MSQKKKTTPRNKLRIIIATILLFIFYGSYSQTNKNNVSPFTLDIKGGVNMPTADFKDYAKNGYQVGVMLNKSVYKNLGLGVSANYNHFGLKDDFESPDNAWSSLSLAVGPQYTLPLNMFFIQVYGHIGMSLINTPGITKDADNIPDYMDVKKYDEGFFNTFKMENESNTGFHTDIGIKLGAQLSKRLSIFVGSTYTTSLNSPIDYSSRDISKAFHPSGEVNTDIIRSIPFEDNSFAFSSLNVNGGITISLGKTSPAKPAQDYNSSRSNRPKPIAWTDAVTDNDSVPGPLHAQDYNSSRSNKPRPIFDTAEKDTVQRPAQDYNSSRSNRPKPIAWSDAATNNDSVPGPLYAQDYNSSRSNKPRPIFDTAEKDTIQRPAQDYNSSRSNRPKPIAWSDAVTDNDTVPRSAQDYNSSRSNKPRPIFDTAEKDTVQRPAQDYNSSRSNRPTPIRRVDDINDINNDEDEVIIIGKLIAIDLKARSFKLIDKNKQNISGEFQSKVTNEEINNLRRDFLNKQANIHVKINKTKLRTGKEVVSYEL